LTPPKPPIFCDHCATLAVAELDGAPLCTDCILVELAGDAEATFAGRVTPLHLMHARDISWDRPAAGDVTPR
jgi:hypothetical protein